MNPAGLTLTIAFDMAIIFLMVTFQKTLCLAFYFAVGMYLILSVTHLLLRFIKKTIFLKRFCPPEKFCLMIEGGISIDWSSAMYLTLDVGNSLMNLCWVLVKNKLGYPTDPLHLEMRRIMKPIFSRIAKTCQHLANMSAVTDGTQVEGENSTSAASTASVGSSAFGDCGASGAFGASGDSSASIDTNSTTVTDSKKTV